MESLLTLFWRGTAMLPDDLKGKVLEYGKELLKHGKDKLLKYGEEKLKLGKDKLLKYGEEKLDEEKKKVRIMKESAEEINKIKKDLEKIHEYLKIAEVLADEDDNIKENVKLVRRIMYGYEDIIESYQLYLDEAQAVVDGARLLPNMQEWKSKHQIASKIVEIDREKLTKMLDLSKIDDVLKRGRDDDPRDTSRTHKFHLVGIEGRKEKLKTTLDLGSQKYRNRHFVAVTGMAGLGKTTVARKVFDEVKDQFDLSAWVVVSQTYDPADLMMKLCKELGVNGDAQGFKDGLSIANALATHLMKDKSKSYLIVLDDVWHHDLLKYIKVALPSDQDGSRLLITTRDQEIGNYWPTVLAGECYSFEPLSEKDAVKLFCRKVFKVDDCPVPNLEQLSRDIVKKCSHVPLIIGAIAGLVAMREQTVVEWSNVRDALGVVFRDSPDYEDTKKIMLYSYHNLPYELKACYLYLGMFPEDHEIRVTRLVQMWIAEGFITPQRNLTLEEVGQKVVNKLFHRGLVMLSPCDPLGGIMVHDVLHDMLKTKLEELEFCCVLSTQSSIMKGQFRRISMSNIRNFKTEMVSKMVSIPNSYSIRSILSFGREEIPDCFASSLPQIAMLLRVLYLNSTANEDFSEELQKLRNLRFLSLRFDEAELPKSICYLSNLETMYIVSYSSSASLASEATQLRKLRHLASCPHVNLPKGVLGSFTELQTLGVNASSDHILVELKNLNQLRKLDISCLSKKDVQAFCNVMQEMTQLRSIFAVWLMSDDEVIELKDLESYPKKLEDLCLLDCKLTSLPSWIGELHSLAHLSFGISDLSEENIFQVIENLPTLHGLWLELYKVDKLDFGETGFKSLRALIIYARNFVLRSISGALPSLQNLLVTTPAEFAVDSLPHLPSHLQSVFHFVIEE